MGYKWVKLSKSGHFLTVGLNMPSYRVFSVLSEYHKIIEFGSTELKLQSFKDSRASVELVSSTGLRREKRRPTTNCSR